MNIKQFCVQNSQAQQASNIHQADPQIAPSLNSPTKVNFKEEKHEQPILIADASQSVWLLTLSIPSYHTNAF